MGGKPLRNWSCAINVNLTMLLCNRIIWQIILARYVQSLPQSQAPPIRVCLNVIISLYGFLAMYFWADKTEFSIEMIVKGDKVLTNM